VTYFFVGHPVDDYETGERLSSVLDLLTFCVERHTYHCKNFVMNRNVGRRVLTLLKSRHAFVSLGMSSFSQIVLKLERLTVILKSNLNKND